MNRIVVFQLGYETNTFIPGAGDLSSMGEWIRADKVVEIFTGKRSGLSGMLAAIEETGNIAIPVDLITRDGTFNAGPTLSREFIENAIDHICEAISHLKGNFDGICADMHGAGTAEGIEDVDGFILKRLRKIAGEKPVMASLDLHANLTQEMIDLSDGLFGIKTNPHIDYYESGYLAARTLINKLDGKINPQMALRRLPLIFPVAAGSTLDGPCKIIKEHIGEYIKKHNLIDATFFHGFFAADTSCTCASLIVVADGYVPNHEADELASFVWEMKSKFTKPSLTAPQAVEEALNKVKDGYVVINEGSDNPGSGCPGDGTHLLRELLKRDLPRSIMGPMLDPKAAEICYAHNIGDIFNLELGGHTVPIYGEPILLQGAELLSLCDGEFVCVSPAHKGTKMHYGPSARIKCGNVEIIVVSKRFQVYDDRPFLMTGADMNDYSIVGLKSSNHFRAFFIEHADDIIGVDTPSMFPGDVRRLSYKNIKRPIYPLDENVEYYGNSL